MMKLLGILDRFRKKDLRELCRLEYGDDFVEKYDKLNMGIPIGNIYETKTFLDKLEAVKEKRGWK